MKGILIISGGVLQIPALKKAKELKLKTYLADGSATCLARSYADVFYQIDTKDIEENAKLAQLLAKEKKIHGVYTQGADVEYTVAYAAKKTGLPGISPEAALNCNDKIRMRQTLARAGIKDTTFAQAKTLDEFKEALKNVGFPCYIKPADNSASRGITRLMNDKGAKNAFVSAMDACFLRKEVLVEHEIRGEEYSIDTVLYQGNLYPAGISDRIFLQKETHAIQSGSRTPSLLPEKIQLRMYEVMEKAARALGVTNGAFKGDLALDEKGNVRIIEVTARTSGGFDSQLRKPFSFGIDIIKATMDIALGNPFDPRDLVPKWVKWSSTISAFPTPGKITEIRGREKLKKLKGVREIIMLAKIGDIIEPYTDCAKRMNYVISCADTLQELITLEKKILAALIIKTKKL